VCGVRDLLAALTGMTPQDEVVLIGISCGLSAPYVAGQLDFIMDAHDGVDLTYAGLSNTSTLPRLSAVLIGFNPIEYARKSTIELWMGRASGHSRSFHDVVHRMKTVYARSSTDQCVIINPIIGPEAVCGSSRMKGGSMTKIILDTIFTTAISTTFNVPLSNAITELQGSFADHDSQSKQSITTVDSTQTIVRNIIVEFNNAFHYTYLSAHSMSEILALCAHSVCSGGHVYYIGDHIFGFLSLIDASEMPDTFGSSYSEVRGFVQNGWMSIGNYDGDLTHKGNLFQISWQDFHNNITNTITQNDTIVVLYHNDSPSDLPLLEQILTNAQHKGANLAKLAIHDDKHEPEQSASTIHFNTECTILLARSGLLADCTALAEFAMKIAVNCISTGAQILKGMVCSNYMINTSPVNNKLYARCIRIISKFAQVDKENAEAALLKAIYDTDDPNLTHLRTQSISVHISAAARFHDRASVEPQSLLPHAILLAAGYDRKGARSALRARRSVRAAILALRT